MDFLGNKFLAGASLTQDQDGGFGSCDYLNLADDPPPGFALTDNVDECLDICRISVVSSDCGSDCLQQIFVVKRLGQKIHRSSLHCPDRHRDVTMTGEKDNRDLQIFPRELLLQFKTVDLGKLDIQH